MNEDIMIFSAETNIAEALEADPRVEAAFRALRLKCPGKEGRGEWCVAVEQETLAHAALYHEIGLDRILAALNALKIPKRR
ncbi:MAG: hypothetical protein HY716_10215 [Planctomycetes bacterium]|nr:hypothetical protein [Planctomycetota bacterium]